MQLPTPRRKFLTSSPRLPTVEGMKLTVSGVAKGDNPIAQKSSQHEINHRTYVFVNIFVDHIIRSTKWKTCASLTM
jgi:hypothetical protein